MPFFAKINALPSLWKKSTPKVGYFFIFSQKTAQSKQTPGGREFDQSGHPDFVAHNAKCAFTTSTKLHTYSVH
jgi:hypothetical protein